MCDMRYAIIVAYLPAKAQAGRPENVSVATAGACVATMMIQKRLEARMPLKPQRLPGKMV